MESLNAKFKDEIILEINAFNNVGSRKDLEALGQVIQNLLLIEKGTLPNQPGLGIGIENYMHEFLDSGTILDLKNSIDDQIDKFIDTSRFIETEVYTIENKFGKKVLVLSFRVSDDPEYKNFDAIEMVVGHDYEEKLVSKILI